MKRRNSIKRMTLEGIQALKMNGHRMWAMRLWHRGRRDEAEAYAVKHGFTVPLESMARGRGSPAPGAGSANESTTPRYTDINRDTDTYTVGPHRLDGGIAGEMALNQTGTVGIEDKAVDAVGNQRRVMEAKAQEPGVVLPMLSATEKIEARPIGIYDPANQEREDAQRRTEAAMEAASRMSTADEPKTDPIEPFRPVREALPAGVVWARVVREARNPLLKLARFEGEGPVSERQEVALWVSRKQGIGLRGRVVAICENPDLGQGGWVIWAKGMVVAGVGAAPAAARQGASPSAVERPEVPLMIPATD